MVKQSAPSRNRIHLSTVLRTTLRLLPAFNSRKHQLIPLDEIRIPYHLLYRIWPAGIPSSPPGTVEWAGGMINWQDPDYVSAGHFYAQYHSVTIKCTGTQKVAAGSDLVSYVYGGNRSDPAPTIVYSNRTTLLNAASGRFGAVGGTGTMLVALAMGAVLGVNALLL